MREFIRHILREHTREISEKWKDEDLEKLASQFNTKSEFLKNNAGAYQSAKKRGDTFFNRITSHMVSGYKLNAQSKKLGKEGFIEKARKIFGDKYNYDKVDYVDAHTRVTITCPTHGDFIIQPYVHLQNHGCKWCGVEKRSDAARTGTDKFIKQAKEVHGDQYDYSKVIYTNRHNPVTIICPKHGEFPQAPGNHIGSKQGCPKCGIEKNAEKSRKSQDEFIKQAKELHKGKYSYDDVVYINALTPVQITCPTHGNFPQEPNSHLRPPSGQGCPRCRDSKGELFISEILESLEIDFVPQKEFDDCTNQIRGRYCRKLKFDFFLPELNTIIEFDGAGHFQPIRASVKTIDGQIKRDKIKNKYCNDNNIKLIRIPYTLPYDLIYDNLIKALESNKKFILLPKYPKKGWNQK
jgi:hypothetical protein